MMIKNKKGCLITLEGGEGAGKTTLIHRLAESLQEEGYQVVKTREPGGSRLSEVIRQQLLNLDFTVKVGDKAELLLFLAARAQHIEELILPAIERGSIVLCDRFNDSTIAYQGCARGLGFDFVKQLCSLVCEGISPKLTLLLDVDPVVGLARTKGALKENAIAGDVDRIEAEALAFHIKVRQAFQAIAQQEPKRVVVVDANGSLEDVYQASWEAVQSHLAKELTG